MYKLQHFCDSKDEKGLAYRISELPITAKLRVFVSIGISYIKKGYAYAYPFSMQIR